MKTHKLSIILATFPTLFLGLELPTNTFSATPYPSSSSVVEIQNYYGPTNNVDTEEYREEVMAQVNKYLTPSGYFDISKAQNNNENKDVIFVGTQINTFNQAMSPTSLRSGWSITKAGQGMFCGYNYCGHGNLGGKPTNVLDEGCRQHDNCYGSRGWGKCSCDTEFIKYIKKNKSKMGWIEWAKAEGAVAYFSLPGCKK